MRHNILRIKGHYIAAELLRRFLKTERTYSKWMPRHLNSCNVSHRVKTVMSDVLSTGCAKWRTSRRVAVVIKVFARKTPQALSRFQREAKSGLGDSDFLISAGEKIDQPDFG